MKVFTKLFSVLVLSLTLLLMIGCESVNGPEGRYIYREGRNLLYSLVFEDDKITISYQGEVKGTFDYEYEKSKDDLDIGIVTVKSEEYPWVMEFNYEIKELRCDVDNNGQLNVFLKYEG